MRSRLLISTAVLAATAILYQANAESLSGSPQHAQAKNMQLAQEKGGAPDGSMGGGGSAPSTRAVPESKGGSEKGAQQRMEKSGGASEKGAQRGMEKSGAEKSTSEKNERSRDTQRDMKKDEKSTQKTEGRDREKMTRDQDRDKGERNASDKNDRSKSTNNKERDSDRASSKSETRGDAKNVHLDNRQETRVKTVIRNQKVTHLKRADIKFSINVGTRIPGSVHWYPLPVEIIEVVPEYRGYYYVIVDEDILIISPSTREIVAVIRIA
ncbi:MAG TPA: DUF1236 domain-containing protein [Xanthobacteraceae bacterium]|nr:DUF1236 domain-containing protein [Xanthobacteraceae bacterium]